MSQSVEAFGSDMRNAAQSVFLSQILVIMFLKVGSRIADMDCHLVIGVAAKSAT